MRRLRSLTPATVVASTVSLVLLGGGVALAAGADPSVPFTGHDNRSTRAPAAPVETNPGLARAAENTPEAEAEVEESPAASPSPSLRGLCTAYQAGARGAQKEVPNPAFGALLTAAGGAAESEAFCDELLVEKNSPAQESRPAHPEKPSHPEKPTRPAKPAKAR